ncbi:MAG: hypothetical protein AB1531_11465 [Chloroflexota bacterium]
MPDKFAYSMICLLAGFMLSQIGIYFGNRWGRSPRPDEIINKNMKGMGREYTAYHYVTPASHLLIGPAGAWTILPLYQGGKIIYDGKRWRTKGGGFARSYLRIFGQESIGRPDLEAAAEIKSVTQHLTRLLPEGTQLPEVRAALLFTDPRAELDVANAPLPAMAPKDLKDFLKAQAKAKPMPSLLLDTVRKALPQPEREED